MKHATHPDLETVSLSSALLALSDPCRQKIVRGLAAAEGTAMACVEFDLEVSKATVSHHFETLRQAGVIQSEVTGKRCLSTLRREEFENRFPGLLSLVLEQ